MYFHVINGCYGINRFAFVCSKRINIALAQSMDMLNLWPMVQCEDGIRKGVLRLFLCRCNQDLIWCWDHVSVLLCASNSELYSLNWTCQRCKSRCDKITSSRSWFREHFSLFLHKMDACTSVFIVYNCWHRFRFWRPPKELLQCVRWPSDATPEVKKVFVSRFETLGRKWTR